MCAQLASMVTLLEDSLAEWKWDPPHTPLSHWICPVVTVALYLIGIPVLQGLMKGKKPWTLKWVQVVYNIILVGLAVSMLLTMMMAAWGRANKLGWLSLICERPEDVPFSGAFGFVIYVFYLSKYIELFDTVLLILKNKPVIPLHMFHHAAVLFIAWSWLDGSWIAGSWWCVFVNSIIHSFMYYYYLLASLGIDVWWKKMLTVGQIIQFWTGFFVVCYWFYIRQEQGCQGGLFTASISHAANCMLIVMFVRFFISTYRKKDNTKKE